MDNEEYNSQNTGSVVGKTEDVTVHFVKDTGVSTGVARAVRAGSEAASPKYVTRRFMIIALVLTLILSSLLGALISSMFMGGGKSAGYSNLDNKSLEEATGSKMTIEEIAARNEDSVVEINTTVTTPSMFGEAIGQGAGSGVIVKEDGYIATNYHVIENSRAITVRLHDGDEYSAQIVGYDQQNDIAVIKIDAPDLTAASIGSSSELGVGDLAVAIGNPLGRLGGTVTSGIISSLDRRLTLDNNTTLDLLQTDAAINPGNSGGGLFNEKGELIGIVVAKSSGTGVEGLGFAIPIDTAAPIIDDLIENGKVSNRPMAGITVYEVSENDAMANGIEPGVYISYVTGVNAKNAGLQEGDRIVSFEGETVDSASGLVRSIQDHKIGDEVTFVVSREGKEVTVKFALEASME
jgi:serine protease Do